MNKHIIIPTRFEEKAESLKQYFESAGWEVHFVVGAKNIFEAYTRGLETAGVKAKDKVILCHDDIEILCTPEIFNKLLDKELDDPRTGFVGVAGSSYINEQINWYACSRQNDAGGGMVYHGDSVFTMEPSVYGRKRKAVILDGLFLATTGKVLYSINLKRPKVFVSNWHHYDASYCLQAHGKKYVNVISPIPIRHASGGNYDETYQRDIPVVAGLFDRLLPAIVH